MKHMDAMNNIHDTHVTLCNHMAAIAKFMMEQVSIHHHVIMNFMSFPSFAQHHIRSSG
jgi:hypothetical protein